MGQFNAEKFNNIYIQVVHWIKYSILTVFIDKIEIRLSEQAMSAVHSVHSITTSIHTVVNDKLKISSIEQTTQLPATGNQERATIILLRDR